MELGLRYRIAKNLRTKGVLKTLTLIIPYLNRARPSIRRREEEELAFDSLYGTDTNGLITRDSLDIRDRALREQCTFYQPTPVWVLRTLFETLPIHHQDYVLVDIGSGKGRTLLIASDYSFKKIIGIEISPHLNEIARNNIQRYEPAARQCHDVTSICVNAAEFSLPAENLVIYLYNPFHESVLATILSNIDASLRQHPRALFLVYTNPVHRALLDEVPFLRLFGETDRYRVYVHVGAAVPGRFGIRDGHVRPG